MNRGRGRGTFSSHIEHIGLEKGDSLPMSVVQPPPLFPSLDNKPLQLRKSLEQDYLLLVRKNLRLFMHDSPYYVLEDVTKNDIERYSDKYQITGEKKENFHYNKNRFPKELFEITTKKKAITIPKVLKTKKLIIAAKEKKDEEKNKDEINDEEGEKDIEEVDEELDEGNDYMNNYFDNGESYLDESDDNFDDGPVY